MSDARYSPWVRHLHWLVFALVACALVLIYIHAFTPKGNLHASVKWAHMQFGAAVLLVMAVRVLVRAWHRAAPPITPAPPRWQTVTAHAVHLLLYVLLIVTPILGITNRMWNPAAWNLLGIAMPHVAHPDAAFAHRIEDIHETLGNIVMYLAAAHALAALAHHYWQRDDTLKRMLPPARSRP